MCPLIRGKLTGKRWRIKILILHLLRRTEGSGYEDEYFQQNFQNASETGIRIGAYHFFSFDSSGITQAEILSKPCQKHKICCRL